VSDISYPEQDNIESPSKQIDAADLDNRISQAEDAQFPEQSDAPSTRDDLQQYSKQLEAETKAAEARKLAELRAQRADAAELSAQTEQLPENQDQASPPESGPHPPEGYTPPSAYGEKGFAERVESGPEKKEVKHFSGGPERRG